MLAARLTGPGCQSTRGDSSTRHGRNDLHHIARLHQGIFPLGTPRDFAVYRYGDTLRGNRHFRQQLTNALRYRTFVDDAVDNHSVTAVTKSTADFDVSGARVTP